jgi:hypothetical protein
MNFILGQQQTKEKYAIYSCKYEVQTKRNFALESSNFIFANNRRVFLKYWNFEQSFKWELMRQSQFSKSLKKINIISYYKRITFKSIVNFSSWFPFFYSISFIFGSTIGNKATIFNVIKIS